MKKTARKPRKATLVDVPLCFSLPDAGWVFIAGTFNDWSTTRTPLARNGDSEWTTRLRLPPGRHEFRLVIDNEWSDPPGINAVVENPFGTRNAVLTVEAPK